MNIFDKKLNGELHKYKAEHGMKVKEIAEDCDIDLHRMYQFTAGNRPLNSDETSRLMEYLNIDLNFRPKQ